MKTKHTPTPWSFIRNGLRESTADGMYILRHKKGEPIAYVDDMNEFNAAFIVRACNAHDDLISALKELSAEMSRDWHLSEQGQRCLKAITKATA